ncbi:MAG TPA: hypothetical protein PKC18_09565 [Lacipirellulaceae bacterium]|nr:hypothetical protein [Lacipirellulaceae bacterium]
MKRLAIALTMLLTAGVALAAPTRAAVISRDWKTPGDGLLTYDDVNQRVWLDLTESRLSMFAGTTFEQRYQNALLELEPGGVLAGFQAATQLDIVAFVTSAGIASYSFDFVTNEIPTMQLIDLVGASFYPAVGGVVSFGLLDELSAPPQSPINQRLTAQLFINPDSGPAGVAGLFIAPGAGDTLSQVGNTGIWLYRAVPEPSGLIASLIAIGVTGFRRGLRKRGAHWPAKGHGRRLAFEVLEHKQVLSISADIVFLVDQSQSVSGESTQAWLRTSLVPRLESTGFADSLAKKGIDNIQYGLVGFSGGIQQSDYANSFVLDSASSGSKLVGSNNQLVSAMNNLHNQFGVVEDGWDAIGGEEKGTGVIALPHCSAFLGRPRGR